MSDSKQPLSLSLFTFGALPRNLLVAIIIQGSTVIGYLRFSASGLVNTNVIPRYLSAVSVVGLFAVVLVFYLAKRIAQSSYSPRLHRPKTPYIVGLGYLILGWVGTGGAFVAHSLILEKSVSLGFSEVVFGFSVGAIFGLLLLLYINRFGVESPDNRAELEEVIRLIHHHRSKITESNKAPIELTDFFESLGDSMGDAADILKDSSTDEGRKLARDIENWLETFCDKPETSQATIVDRSRSPEQKDLNNLESEFDSIVKRIDKISHHE